MALSAPEACVRTLVAKLNDGSPGIVATEIIEGWDRQDGDITCPVLGVDASAPGTRRRAQVGVLSRVDADPNDPTNPDETVIAVTAYLEIPISLNVWAESPAQRSKVERAVEEAFRLNPFEDGSRLTLMATDADYFGACITFRQNGTWRHTDNAKSASEREYRGEFEVLAELPELVQVSVKKLLTLELDTSVIVSDDDYPAIDQEEVTIFAPS